MPRADLMPRLSPRSVRWTRLAVPAIDAVLLALVVGSQFADTGPGFGIAFLALIVALVIGLALIGRLIVDRQPGNAVGWIFMASSIGMATATAAHSWVPLSMDRFGSGLPGTGLRRG